MTYQRRKRRQVGASCVPTNSTRARQHHRAVTRLAVHAQLEVLCHLEGVEAGGAQADGGVGGLGGVDSPQQQLFARWAPSESVPRDIQSYMGGDTAQRR